MVIFVLLVSFRNGTLLNNSGNGYEGVFILQCLHEFFIDVWEGKFPSVNVLYIWLGRGVPLSKCFILELYTGAVEPIIHNSFPSSMQGPLQFFLILFSSTICSDHGLHLVSFFPFFCCPTLGTIPTTDVDNIHTHACVMTSAWCISSGL